MTYAALNGLQWLISPSANNIDMISTPQYVIEMDSKFNYPFKGPKNAAFHVQVKATLHFDADGKAHAAVSNLVTIDSPNIIKMTEVL